MGGVLVIVGVAALSVGVFLLRAIILVAPQNNKLTKELI